MSVLVRVRDGVAHVSPGRLEATDPPFLTAVVEAAGGLLLTDATVDATVEADVREIRVPDAVIDDVDAAGAWLADLYGPEVADAVRQGAETSPEWTGPGDAGIADAVHRLGQLTWARAWWPAGARIPAVDPSLLAAEIAVTSDLLSHLLDDDEAVERALRDAADIRSALAALPSALAAEGAQLAAALHDLADDLGVELLPARENREDWALAAGGTGPVADRPGIEVASGTAPVRWADVPAQTVDAEGLARWSLRQSDGSLMLQIEVPAVDADFAARALRARFGPADSDIDVALERQGGRFRGETAVAASVAFLPAGERMLWVRDPALASSPGEPDSGSDRERVLRHASARWGAPGASFAERVAGAVR
ncbi:hypothetical protein [Microbacterium sp. W4I20]|uniref:hypothetical protein n=1 Tax=Microbacterium sp. W4I20 TaxID=3042262 RepID=UPI002783067C|nr:hypothetical protein [Microbacterium sp. W4I20]MDQ0728401.1 hypothetical protein [Microbacterium sp. W4I20]